MTLGEFLKVWRPTVDPNNTDIIVTINVDAYYTGSKKYFACRTCVDEEKLADVQSRLADDEREIHSIELVYSRNGNPHLLVDIIEWIDCAADFFRNGKEETYAT